jgi:hypothetical protein
MRNNMSEISQMIILRMRSIPVVYHFPKIGIFIDMMTVPFVIRRFKPTTDVYNRLIRCIRAALIVGNTVQIVSADVDFHLHRMRIIAKMTDVFRLIVIESQG